VLGHVESRGLAEVARVVAEALRRDQPLLLALAPPEPVVSLPPVELPLAPRAVEVAAGSAADHDRLF
jgi:hypothetical protein